MRKAHWQDWVIVLAGVWLVLSPFWMESYPLITGIAALNSFSCGALLAVVGILAIYRPKRWQIWTLFLVAVWSIASPIALGYLAPRPGAAWNNMLCGIVVILMTLPNLGSPATPKRGAPA